MIKFSKDYTTPAQSKRLLDLGVPADSANMYYKQYSEAVVYVGEVGDVPQPKTYYIHEPELRHINPEGTWTYKDGEKIDLSGKYDELRKTDIPCWSVGRLIEIYEICSGKKYERKSARLVREGNVSVMKELTIIEDIIGDIVNARLYIYPHIDFSKLK